MPVYFQQYFIQVSESNEYEKIQIMQSLNEPNTGKTQILEHGHSLVIVFNWKMQIRRALLSHT